MTAPLQKTVPDMRGRRALMLALVALVFTVMLPAAGLALSLFGIIVAIRDLRALQGARQRIGMATGAIVIASIAFLLGTVTTAFQLYFSAELSSYTECRKGAGTIEARQDCSDQLMQSFEKRLGVRWPSGVPAPA
ncbi:hypothetical protein [Microbispora sp. NPDC049125]|uniref:hypothetical protein n=1 Tax=Microbispora sp. NPDC049125 TaxID=3154929 RepID=UPI003466CE81